MLQVMVDTPSAGHGCQLNTLHLTMFEVMPKSLSELLTADEQVFLEPTILPPQRGVFDHRITLQLEFIPIHIIPYKYSSMKKDIIEKLVKEILQQ